MTQRKRNRKKYSSQFPPTDSLYVIFEQHLYNFEDVTTDRKTFIGNIIKDYIKYLAKSSRIVAPQHVQDLVGELFEEINTMLLKKIYGFSSIEEFRSQSGTTIRQKVNDQYRKLANGRSVKAKVRAGAR